MSEAEKFGKGICLKSARSGSWVGWGSGVSVLGATSHGADNPCIVEYQCVTGQIMGIMESQLFAVSGSDEAVLCVAATSYTATYLSH